MNYTTPPSPVSPEQRDAFALNSGLESLSDCYDKVVISDGSDAPEPFIQKGKALLVTSDWLEWRRLSSRGIPSIHLDHILADGSDLPDDPDIYLRYMDWRFKDGLDLTAFEGASLGAPFWREVTLACRERDRLYAAVSRLCDRFDPCELVVVGQNDHSNMLDPDTRLSLIKTAAAPRKVEFVATGAGRRPGEVRARPRHMRRYLRNLYARLAGVVSNSIRRLHGGKPSVFLLLNGTALFPILAEASADRSVTPVILAEQWPKNPKFVFDCWRRGVMLAELPLVSLSPAQKRAITRIFARIVDAWRDPADVKEEARRTFLRRNVLKEGRLEAVAVRLLRYRRLCEKNRIARVVVGDATNPECRIVLEAAATRGVGCDEYLNGIFMTRRHCDARISHPGRSSLVSRILVWGQAGLRWAAATAEGTAALAVGYAPMRERGQSTRSPHLGKRWLVLPCYGDADDVRWAPANTLCLLMATLGVLSRQGFMDIRIKLHPGWPLSCTTVATALAEEGFSVPIYQEGTLAPHLLWADAIIGPANSGGWLEALAAGREYYPLCPEPTSFETRFLCRVEIFRSAVELAGAIRSGHSPDRGRALAELCNSPEVIDPARRFWTAIESAV